MRRMLLAVLLLAAPPALAQTDHAAIADRTLHQHILPGFATLAEATATLAAEADAACSGAGPIEVAPVQAAYARAFDAWAAIGHIRFGPAEEDNAGFGVEFWPDTRGATPRALGTMIAAEDPVVDDPARFHSISVAARGLMALDWLLYDPEAGAIDADSYRCRLLVAISRDLADTAAAILAGWHDPWGGILTSAGAPDNPVYLAPEESTRALYSALVDGLQADVDLRLGRPLGTYDKPEPRRAEAWRSGRSLPNVVASLQGMRQLAATAFGPAIGATEAATVDATFAAALAAADGIGEPLDAAVASTAGHVRVESLQGAITRIRTQIAEHVGPAIGVTSGFNALDGD